MFRYLLSSLAYHWRVNAAVAFGAAVATAVLTGALLVGDSVRGSLRALTLDRLGNIDEVLVLDRFFRMQLASDLATPDAQEQVKIVAPAILFPHGTIERIAGGKTSRVSSVLILGCNEQFWRLDSHDRRPKVLPGPNEVVLNDALATELQAKVGDQVTLRFPKMNQVPADSPLASKNDRVRGLPGLKVVDIIPTVGLGQFSMQASQGTPSNAFVSLETLQNALGQEDLINALFVSRQHDRKVEPHDVSQFLKPTLADVGISITHVTRSFREADGKDTVSLDYYSITSERMIIADDVAAIIQRALPESQPVLTYLANSIEVKRSGDATTGTTPREELSLVADAVEKFRVPRNPTRQRGRTGETFSLTSAPYSQARMDRTTIHSQVLELHSSWFYPLAPVTLPPESQQFKEVVAGKGMGERVRERGPARRSIFPRPDPLFVTATFAERKATIEEQIAAKANPTAIPYSMVSAVDPNDTFFLTSVAGERIPKLSKNEIVLNQWAAENLQAKEGDIIQVAYFEPETTHGQAVEKVAEFKLKAIAGLTEPVQPLRRNRPVEFDRPLTPATDPNYTPEVKGVTDQDTIDDWDAPFPFDYTRVRDVDEEYWDNHRTTPKAFISADAGHRLWGSRFGQVTSLRVPNDRDEQAISNAIQQEITQNAAALGFAFIPIKQRQIEASSGTTPFDALFLALSFFVIGAALLMVALLFQLGTEQRSTEIGTLLAIGFPRRRVSRMFVIEGTLLAAIGAIAGIAIGLGYARLMLAGLKSWWLGAITTPFLSFYATPRSLLIGYFVGVLISAGTIAWTVWRMRKLSVRRLLTRQLVEPANKRANRLGNWLILACIGLALGLVIGAVGLGGMAQAGAFVTGGALLLTGLLLAIRRRLKSAIPSPTVRWTTGSTLWKLAVRSGARNPGRSTITIALMATATFLIVAMSSFRLAPTEQGVGGFGLLAESSEPVYADLNVPARRAEFFGTQAGILTESAIFGFRLRSGDDASCNNLYQASQPRVLGVSRSFVEYFDQTKVSFSWAGSAASDSKAHANPWWVLFESAADNQQPIPVVVDKNTAMYSLRLFRGIGEEFDFNYDGRTIRFKVAGLLSNSVLQGNLLISERDFQRNFPDLSGYRFFLIHCPPQKTERVGQLLEEQFGDQGFDVRRSVDVLAQLLAVQNTYLSTFQSLGALGLLLGTLGLATVQLRNVLERRGELALMRAAGYRRRRLAQLVLLENLALLVAGLLTGIVAAALAVLPHKLIGESAISWSLLRDLGVMLAAVFLAGMIASFLSVRAVLRLKVISSLRSD